MSNDPFSDKQAADDFLMGSSIPHQVFPKVGFTVSLTVLSWEMADQTDMQTGEVKTWDDGKPRRQLVVTCLGEVTGKTWETNQYIEKVLEEDDGQRKLYVKGNLRKALTAGIKDAGLRGMEKGLGLTITRVKDGKPAQKGWTPPHDFQIKVTPSAKNAKWAEYIAADADDFLSDEDENPFAK